MSFHQVTIANRQLSLDSLKCSGVAKYFILDCFTVTKSGENERIIKVHEEDRNFSAGMNALDAFQMETLWYMFDYLGEFTVRPHVTTNYILHPSSEHFALLLACCRYCVQHKEIKRSLVRLMHNVYVGIIWLPLYAQNANRGFPNSFMFVLFEGKMPHFDRIPFQDMLVSASYLCDMQGSTIGDWSSSPLLHVSWCTDHLAFTEQQHEEINQFISELTPSVMPQPPKKRPQPPRRRFVVSQSPLSHLETPPQQDGGNSVSPSVLMSSPKSDSTSFAPPLPKPTTTTPQRDEEPLEKIDTGISKLEVIPPAPRKERTTTTKMGGRHLDKLETDIPNETHKVEESPPKRFTTTFPSQQPSFL
eukprot:CAMPEP_0117454288 /NCGR_PEP_ID=MMETSP0759-20121206/10720_1 /TAXON_ID=63605 /ORGANISM="Percolomonas cosmopolitus, Strain WS" /LENGTH=359 /DNA_ID=CAMNT_0005247463 /DNA_START=527 /DNA_END=1603 /DNA_ORIENTATION=+